MEFKFDFSLWKLRDVLTFQKTGYDGEKQLPLMVKATVSTPFGVDVSSPDIIDQLNAEQWALWQKEFSKALSAVFQ